MYWVVTYCTIRDGPIVDPVFNPLALDVFGKPRADLSPAEIKPD
jgi:hypothetical protein